MPCWLRLVPWRTIPVFCSVVPKIQRKEAMYAQQLFQLAFVMSQCLVILLFA